MPSILLAHCTIWGGPNTVNYTQPNKVTYSKFVSFLCLRNQNIVDQKILSFQLLGLQLIKSLVCFQIFRMLSGIRFAKCNRTI